MDLENNHRGRNLGEIYSANSFNDIVATEAVIISSSGLR